MYNILYSPIKFKHITTLNLIIFFTITFEQSYGMFLC